MIGESFTLKRFSDDSVVLIASTTSLGLNFPETIALSGSGLNSFKTSSIDAKQPGQIKQASSLNKKELFDEMGKYFDTINSVLSPTEVIGLLSGTPSDETLKVATEITKLNHKPLFEILKTPQKISQIFTVFGKTTGLDTLKDRLNVLTANPDNIKKIAPVKDCPPFENIFNFREQLLKKTVPADISKKIIKDLIDKRKKRFKDIQDGLSKIKDGNIPFDLKDILCGSGKNIDGSKNKIVEDSLNTTFDLLFEPTKMMFNREITKYPDALSLYKETQIPISRRVSNKTGLPIFNPLSTDGTLFTSLAKLLGVDSLEDKDDRRINPEFKKMVDSGFVPVKKTRRGKKRLCYRPAQKIKIILMEMNQYLKKI